MNELRTMEAGTYRTRASAVKHYCASRLSGVCFCLLLVLASSYISDHYGSSKILGALLLGMAFNNISRYREFAPGLNFCAKHVLRVGVALLGVRITFSQISELGLAPLIVVVTVVVSTILFSSVVAYVFKVDRVSAVISGAAVGICGVSAALAVAAVLPRSKEAEKHLLCTVIGVACISTICMILYPGMLIALEMTPEQMGIFLGASIHDVAQVFGAGDMISASVSQLATYTKMLRVAMLMPVIVLLALLFQNAHSSAPDIESSKRQRLRIFHILPPFLLAFVGFVFLANIAFVPAPAIDTLSDFSRICLWVAMAALGAKTNLLELWQVGRTPFILLILNTFFIASLSLLLVL